jgi:hypothetical protein
VLLERKADRLEGRFTARYGAFMVMRQHDNHDGPSPPWQPELPLDRERTTITPAEPSGVVRFLRSVMSSTQLRHGYTFDAQTRQPTAIRLAAADGSCCEVDLTQAETGPVSCARVDQHRSGGRSNAPTNNGTTGANRAGTGSVSQ